MNKVTVGWTLDSIRWDGNECWMAEYVVMLLFWTIEARFIEDPGRGNGRGRFHEAVTHFLISRVFVQRLCERENVIMKCYPLGERGGFAMISKV